MSKKPPKGELNALAQDVLSSLDGTGKSPQEFALAVEEQLMSAFVYLIEEEPLHGESSGPWTKIGYSQNPPEWRMHANLKRGNPRNIRVAAAFEYETGEQARAAERNAQERFSKPARPLTCSGSVLLARASLCRRAQRPRIMQGMMPGQIVILEIIFEGPLVDLLVDVGDDKTESPRLSWRLFGLSHAVSATS